MRGFIFAFIIFIISGCVSQEHLSRVNEQRSRFYETIPSCSGEKECSTMWDAAQVWVVRNSKFKIQTATNVLIETYSPNQYNIGIGFTVIKEPVGGGNYRIIISTSCWNGIYGCSPRDVDLKQEFNSYINKIKPAPQDEDDEIGV